MTSSTPSIDGQLYDFEEIARLVGLAALGRGTTPLIASLIPIDGQRERVACPALLADGLLAERDRPAWEAEPPRRSFR